MKMRDVRGVWRATEQVRALLEWPTHAAIKAGHEWAPGERVASHPCAMKLRMNGAPEHLRRVEEMRGFFASLRMTGKNNGKATANSSLFGFAQGRLLRCGMEVQQGNEVKMQREKHFRKRGLQTAVLKQEARLVGRAR